MGYGMSINTSGEHRPNTRTDRPHSTSQSTGRPSTLNDVEARKTNTPARTMSLFQLFMTEELARKTSLLEEALVGKSVDNNAQEALEYFVNQTTSSTPATAPGLTNPDVLTDREALTQSIENHLNATDTSLTQTFKVIKAMNRVNMDDIHDGGIAYIYDGGRGNARPNNELHYKACAIAAQDYREAMNTLETTKSEIGRLKELEEIENDESSSLTSLLGCLRSERKAHLKQVQSLSTRLAENTKSIQELYIPKRWDIVASSILANRESTR